MFSDDALCLCIRGLGSVSKSLLTAHHWITTYQAPGPHIHIHHSPRHNHNRCNHHTGMTMSYTLCWYIATRTNYNLKDIYFFGLGLTTREEFSLILSQVSRKVGRKREIPKKKNHLTNRKQNLACLT